MVEREGIGMMEFSYPLEETKYGFNWGPATVERVCSDAQGGVLLVIKARKAELEVRVTPNGYCITSNLKVKKRNDALGLA